MYREYMERKRFILYSLVGLFNQLLLEAFSQFARRLIIHISAIVYSQAFTQLSELERCTVEELVHGYSNPGLLS